MFREEQTYATMLNFAIPIEREVRGIGSPAKLVSRIGAVRVAARAAERGGLVLDQSQKACAV